MQRVKVYRLNQEGMWDDKGTGSVSVEYMEVNSLKMVYVWARNNPGLAGCEVQLDAWLSAVAHPLTAAWAALSAPCS